MIRTRMPLPRFVLVTWALVIVGTPSRSRTDRTLLFEKSRFAKLRMGALVDVDWI